MLRVGLTGELGSGKSTVAAMLAARGAHVFSSDEMGRAMMQPGEKVYRQITDRFGPGVLHPDGTLDRRKLAQVAFGEGRTEELNSIVHPAVIEEQAHVLAALAQREPDAIAVVESALIFSTRHGLGGQPWRERFDTLLIVTAPEEQQIARFLARMEASSATPVSAAERVALTEDAQRRLTLQRAGNTEALQLALGNAQPQTMLVRNDAGVEELERQVDAVWQRLRELERTSG